MGSHKDLPPNERNVKVYIYASRLTSEQLRENVTLQIMDKKKTTDQMLLETAERKRVVNEQFLAAMQSAAVDCPVHRFPGIRCFAPSRMKSRHGFQEDLVFMPEFHLDDDGSGLGAKETADAIKVTIQGIPYILIRSTRELLDYDLYMRTRELQVVGSLQSVDKGTYYIKLLSTV
jgi:hypothetical protein